MSIVNYWLQTCGQKNYKTAAAANTFNHPVIRVFPRTKGDKGSEAKGSRPAKLQYTQGSYTNNYFTFVSDILFLFSYV